jgi:hypothetical protein
MKAADELVEIAVLNSVRRSVQGGEQKQQDYEQPDGT